MVFVVLKSYDGGKHWEPERQCSDFATAADAAQALRAEHPSIRFRVDVEASRRSAELSSRKGRRSLPAR